VRSWSSWSHRTLALPGDQGSTADVAVLEPDQPDGGRAAAATTSAMRGSAAAEFRAPRPVVGRDGLLDPRLTMRLHGLAFLT